MKPAHNPRTYRIFYASPLIFAAACGLLAIIIGVFAVNNYQREKKLMETALSQEARAILNLVSASFRGSMRRGAMAESFDRLNWIETINEHIENSAEHPGLRGLYLVDRNGVVRSHTNRSEVGRVVDDQTLRMLASVGTDSQHEVSGFVGDPAEPGAFFRMAVRYQLPPGIKDMILSRQRGRMGRMRPDLPEPGGFMDMLEASMKDAPFVLVAELNLDQYRQAMRKQILQIVILSAVLLLVGIGGLLSLIVLQNYKGSQRRLRSMSTFTDILLSSLPVGLMAISSNGRIRTCNPSAAHMLNISETECLGKPVGEVLENKLLKRLEANAGEPLSHWEMDSLGDSGIEQTLHFTRLQIDEEEHEDPGTMLLVQDLSQLRELETQLQRAERDAVVGRMAAAVAHELRNPLSSVKGLALLLKSRLGQDGDGRQAADLMAEQVDRLNRSISELLDYARPSSLQKTELAVDELLKKAFALIQTDAQAAGVDIVEQYDCPSCRIHGDQDKLTQVFLNLSLNALQAMDQGGRLRVASHQEDTWVVITVADSGCGIPEAIRDKIFEPYFTTQHDGTGLGLAMSAKIISDHGGSIDMVSSEGRGTTVLVRIPRY
jgi:two-component system sensor histidine kinase HydH